MQTPKLFQTFRVQDILKILDFRHVCSKLFPLFGRNGCVYYFANKKRKLVQIDKINPRHLMDQYIRHLGLGRPIEHQRPDIAEVVPRCSQPKAVTHGTLTSCRTAAILKSKENNN